MFFVLCQCLEEMSLLRSLDVTRDFDAVSNRMGDKWDGMVKNALDSFGVTSATVS
jgi:hypothetical protein